MDEEHDQGEYAVGLHGQFRHSPHAQPTRSSKTALPGGGHSPLTLFVKNHVPARYPVVLAQGAFSASYSKYL